MGGKLRLSSIYFCNSLKELTLWASHLLNMKNQHSSYLQSKRDSINDRVNAYEIKASSCSVVLYQEYQEYPSL